MVPSRAAAGVLAVGTYFPRTAVMRRGLPVPVPNGDEDAVTMAIEAGLRCVESAPAGGPSIDEVVLVAAGGPPLVSTHVEVVREALGLPSDVRVSLAMGDRLGAISALLNGVDAIKSGRVAGVLVLAVELGDAATVGAAAAAMLIGASLEPLISLSAVRSEGAVAFDRWQDAHGEAAMNEPRYTQHGVARGLAALLNQVETETPLFLTGASASSVPPAPDGSSPRRVRTLRDVGVAGPVFALVSGACESSGAFTVVAATGSRVAIVTCHAGKGVAALALEPGLDAFAADQAMQPEVEVSPMLSLPTASPFFQRSAREMLRLEAARCVRCGHVVFPATQRPVCSGCHGTAFTPTPLNRFGTVHTFTENRFLPTGFGNHMVLVLADLDDGNRYFAPVSAPGAPEIAIGARVRLGIRRFSNHGGASVYAMKFFATGPESDARSSAERAMT